MCLAIVAFIVPLITEAVAGQLEEEPLEARLAGLDRDEFGLFGIEDLQHTRNSLMRPSVFASAGRTMQHEP